MENLIQGANSFSDLIRFQLFKKKYQTLKKSSYAHKIWGSHVKGGLEICDALLIENQEEPFTSSDDIDSRLKKISIKLEEETKNVNKAISFDEYISMKISKNFGKASKEKLYAEEFREDVRDSCLRGSFKTCEKLLDMVKDDPAECVDTRLGDIHIIRMELWNIYADYNNMKKVTVTEAMEVEVSRLAYN